MLVYDELSHVKVHTPSTIKKSKLDLAVLKYMARRLHLLLRQLDPPPSPTRPPLYLLEERHDRTHRIVIYKHRQLLLESSFFFVGFISRKQKYLLPTISKAIARVDKKLIQELAQGPGILSYSSLELRNGDWCNLVVMSDAQAKGGIKSNKTHAYAAHQLAYRYYEWIRLHNGILPEGLDHTEMRLLKTRHYTFQPMRKRPLIQEETYGAYS